MRRNMIVLTMSSKHDGYCVAGIDAVTGEWIRLVTNDKLTEGAVPREDMFYETGEHVQIYDIISVEIISDVGTAVQPENKLYDRTVAITKVGQSDLNNVIELHGFDTPKYVFGNAGKELREDEISTVSESLLLLAVEKPEYSVMEYDDGTKVVQLNFDYNGVRYKYIKVSQIDIKRKLLMCPRGYYQTESCVFVLSLTDRYTKTGKYYKMMAQELC